MKIKTKILALEVTMILLLAGCGNLVNDSSVENDVLSDVTTTADDDFDEIQQSQTTNREIASAEDDSEKLQNNTQMAENIDKEEPELEVVEEKTDIKETETEVTEDYTVDSSVDESIYIGEYLDENNDPGLEIAKGDDGNYTVQVGIFRLTTLDDGIGKLTPDGLDFTATDASGNPIGAVVTIDNQTATVTFTDSTWTYIENGDTFQYIKSSDTPNLWTVY